MPAKSLYKDDNIARSLTYIHFLRKSDRLGLAKEKLNTIISNKPALIAPYLQYEEFLNDCYQHAGAKYYYEKGYKLKDTPISRVAIAESEYSSNPIVKRLVYDGLVDGILSGVNKTSINCIGKNTSIFKKSFELVEASHIRANKASIIDIVINIFGVDSAEKPSKFDSHMLMLFELIRSTARFHVNCRVYILGLPFSGLGWPRGDNVSTFNNQTLCAVALLLIEHCMNSNISLPEIYCLKKIEHENIISCYERALIAYNNRPVDGVVAEVDFSCISGSTFSLFHRPPGRRFIVTPSINVPLYSLPTSINAVISQDCKRIICPVKTYNLEVPYTPHKSAYLLEEYEISTISKLQDFDKPICIICSSYLEHAFATMSKDTCLYKGLRKCILIAIGPHNNNHINNIMDNKNSLYEIPYCRNLAEFYRLIGKYIPEAFTIVPYGMTGMSTSLLLSASYGIGYVASLPHDAAEYVKRIGFSESKNQYASRLEKFTKGESRSTSHINQTRLIQNTLRSRNELVRDKLLKVLTGTI